MVPLLEMHPHTKFINESGLYSLILASKKPEAKKFKHYVTSVILPTIRKTGKFEMTPTLQIKKDKLELSTCKTLLKLQHPTTRDELLVADILRNKLSQQPTTKLITDKSTEEWSVSRRLQEHFNITSKKMHMKLSNFGKLMKKEYEKHYDNKPPTRQEYVNGTVRNVNHYVLKDWEL